MPKHPKPTTSNAVWIATAILHQENKDKDAFQAKEIFQKVKDLDLQGASDETLKIHISSHCVASGKASPDTHRKLVRVQNGWYRLFRPGDSFHPTRERGRIAPLAEEIPSDYSSLLEWYNNKYCKTVKDSSRLQEDSTIPSFSRISQDGTIKIPKEVQDKMNLQEGDFLAFLENQGVFTIKKATMQVE